MYAASPFETGRLGCERRLSILRHARLQHILYHNILGIDSVSALHFAQGVQGGDGDGRVGGAQLTDRRRPLRTQLPHRTRRRRRAALREPAAGAAVNGRVLKSFGPLCFPVFFLQL